MVVIPWNSTRITPSYNHPTLDHQRHLPLSSPLSPSRCHEGGPDARIKPARPCTGEWTGEPPAAIRGAAAVSVVREENHLSSPKTRLLPAAYQVASQKVSVGLHFSLLLLRICSDSTSLTASEAASPQAPLPCPRFSKPQSHNPSTEKQTQQYISPQSFLSRLPRQPAGLRR